MDTLKCVAVAWALLLQVEGLTGIENFLKSFVENEQKPTIVVFHGVCWRNSFKVHLMKELSKVGVRSCPSLSERTTLQDHAVLLLTDLDCPGTAELFKNATRRELQRLPYRWLALSSAPVRGRSPFWDKFLVDSDLLVAAKEGEGYRMTEVHKPGPTRPTVLTPRGVFHGVLTDVRPRREFFRRRGDVRRAPLTMINVIQDSKTTKYHMLQEDLLELEYDIITKIGWVYGKLGFLMLNATPTPVFTNRFGYFVNGQWTGVINELIQNKGDIGTNTGISSARFKVITYVDVMDTSRLRFIFRQPPLSSTSNIFSLPFSSQVWMAVAVTCLVAGLAYYLSTRLVGILRGRDHTRLTDAFLLSSAALSQQGCDLEPKNISARIILFVLFTSLMALYAAYSANIVVLLQAPSQWRIYKFSRLKPTQPAGKSATAPSTAINSLKHLAESKLSLAAVDVDYSHFLFKGDPDPVHNAISKKIEPNEGPHEFYNLTEGVERIRQGSFAFHSLVEPVYRQIEKTFQEKEKCDLIEIDYFGYSGMYTPANRKSPYLELLRVVFKRLREVGVKSALNFRYEARKPLCKETVAFSSVGVMELQPVLVFMAYGVGLSVVVLAAELLVFHGNRYRHYRRRVAEELWASRN